MEQKGQTEKQIIESLSPIEKRILPVLTSKTESIDEITIKSGLDKTSILRALEFLKNKKLAEVNSKEDKLVDLDVNGILYLKKGLPERRLLNEVSEKKSIPLGDLQKIGLNENEAKIALGVLRKKAMINISSEGKILINAKKEEVSKKSLEEQFLEKLPLKLSQLKPEEEFAFKNLQSRKEIIRIVEQKEFFCSLTELGQKLSKTNLSSDLIEQLTPKIIQSGSWKGKKFRRYDIISPVPRLYGGKRHFVNQATDYAKKIWLEMGFKEMEGDLATTGFWNFDALFTAQDHPAREMQDTFFIKDIEGKLPDKKLVEKIKESHEGKIEGSKGWQYEWQEKEAKKVLLRTHTTCLSTQTLKKIADAKEFPAKYFALGKVFRNETVDQGHLFEFYQTEGIVIDENANFRQLMGFLIQFYKKMGYEKVRIRPSYFAYTEPSLEVDVFHPVLKKWIELGGAGMFRPEVTIPFFGRHVPVLAWGQGVDRIIREFFGIIDLRDMYKNNLNKLRETKVWIK
jgi:phenylalanyl-tRNA synthetase alpha chain